MAESKLSPEVDSEMLVKFLVETRAGGMADLKINDLLDLVAGDAMPIIADALQGSVNGRGDSSPLSIFEIVASRGDERRDLKAYHFLFGTDGEDHVSVVTPFEIPGYGEAPWVGRSDPAREDSCASGAAALGLVQVFESEPRIEELFAGQDETLGDVCEMLASGCGPRLLSHKASRWAVLDSLNRVLGRHPDVAPDVVVRGVSGLLANLDKSYSSRSGPVDLGLGVCASQREALKDDRRRRRYVATGCGHMPD